MTIFLSRRRPFGLFPALLTLFIFSLTGCQKFPSRSTASPVPTALPYTDQILYTSSGQLDLTSVDGGQTSRFSGAGRNNWFPMVSPDFTRVAFWSTSNGSYELWVYTLADEKLQQLTFFNQKVSQAHLQNFNLHNAPAWSPDGKRIIFSHGASLWSVDAQGFNLETVLADGVYYAPALSPDGKLLAYVSERDQARNLYVRRLSTNEEWPVTAFPFTHQAGSPSWSPDGTLLAFALAAGEQVDIWLVRPDGEQLQRLTQDGYSNSPSWSPDGQSLAFASGRQDPYRWEIWVMNRNGGGQFAVTRNGGSSPVWIRMEKQAAQPVAGSAPIAEERPVTAVSPRQTSRPTTGPTPQPTPKPTPHPTAKPTARPTAKPVAKPTAQPAAKPTSRPTAAAPSKPAAVSTPAAGAGEEAEYEEFEEYADEDEAVLPQSELKSAVEGNRVVFSPKIEFYFAKDLIKPVSLPTLKQLAEELDAYPDASLVVKGYMRGPGIFKKILPILKTLSRARANSVLRHLIVNEKIRQINVTALGETDPFPDLVRSQDKPLLIVEIK
jgi:outer membrane protein OmpA-like peptidoglycan-associated protein